MATTVTTPNFVVDPKSVDRTTGKQVDWDQTHASTYGTTPKRFIPKGTRFVELASGKLLTYADRLAAETVKYISETDIQEDPKEPNANAFGFFTNGTLFENALPGVDGSGDLPAQEKTDCEALGFHFERLTDSRTGVS